MARPKKPEKPERRRWHTGSISTLPDGRIRARLPAALDPKRTAREFPAGRRDLAEAWLAAHLAPPEDRPSAPTVSLGDWAGAWWQSAVEPLMAPNSSKAYLYALRQLAPLFATPVHEVRPSALQGIVADLARRVSPASVQNVVGVWRRCLEAAVDDGLVPRNPAKRLALPRPSRRPPPRRVTREEARAILDASVGHRYEAAYALLIGCGLRIGEVLGLHWRDVDLERRRIWVQHQFTNGHWRDLPKGRESRFAPLPSFVVAALIRHRDRQPEGAQLVMQSPWPPPKKSGRKRGDPWPVSRNSVVTDLEKLVAELGIDRITPHAGRRGLASALIEGGASPAAVAERLGHADPGVTLRRYVIGDTEAREKADALAEEYLGGDAPER